MLERASIPGFVWARRYRALQSPRKYLALYRTEQLAVFDSPAYQEAFTHRPQGRGKILAHSQYRSSGHWCDPPPSDRRDLVRGGAGGPIGWGPGRPRRAG